MSDEEKREVAERLRELGKLCYAPDNTYELMIDALGVDDLDGTDELFNRLADLIDPGESGQNLDTNRDTVQIESPAVQKAPERDREALLALADDLETYRLPISGIAVAEHIREACGVIRDE